MNVGARVLHHVSGQYGIIVKVIREYKPYVFHVIVLDSNEVVCCKKSSFSAWQNKSLFSITGRLTTEELLTHSNRHVRKIGKRRVKEKQNG